MMLLPARCPPSRKALAIFVGCRRIMKPGEILYMPQWSSSTLIERAPAIEAIPDEIGSLVIDMGQLEIDTRNQVKLLESVLAMNWNQPFDAIFLKGLHANVC